MYANNLFRRLSVYPNAAIRPILLLVLGWHLSATPAAANIGTASLTATSSTSAVLSFSHAGYQANPFPFGVAQGKKYRVCWRQLNQIGLACIYNAENTNGAVQITGLTVGLPINITIQCWCGKERDYLPPGPFSNRIVVNMNYTHQLPPPAPGLVGSTNVRVRGVQSGQCLFVNSSNALVRGWSCWGDPAMVFALETFSNGTKRLHHVQSGLCITTIGLTSEIFALPCGGSGSMLTITPQSGSGGPVFVRFMFASGVKKCLAANTANGLNATRQICNIAGVALMLDPV